LAAHVVGTVGPVTAERLLALGAPYGPADLVGLSGVEETYERELAGTPQARIVRINRYGREIETLLEANGTPPQNVTTTIDVAVQMAAEQALEGITKPSAVVIVDTETSEVLASVSRPMDGFDRAFLGTYPPGSTFKIVTAAALLENGMTTTTTSPVRARSRWVGVDLRNAGGRDSGRSPWRRPSPNRATRPSTASPRSDSGIILGAVARSFDSRSAPAAAGSDLAAP
jgi:cell division protein FtsI/penicillin-binding protein 2